MGDFLGDSFLMILILLSHRILRGGYLFLLHQIEIDTEVNEVMKIQTRWDWGILACYEG